MEEYNCRICGMEYNEPTWFNENESSFDTCVCCGVEFGIQDSNKTGVMEYRNNWLKKGALWEHEKYKPKIYLLEDYLKKIDDKWW